MLNRDIYNKPPKENRLVNNGVAEVSEDHSDAAQAILRYELETFVCDGQYEKGLETILDKFLLNLDAGTEQPGVWISGFYGSGKSHLAKMLRTLWTDYQFADGATARSLAKLPTGVFEHLKELSTQGKRHGALHAAAGKLGAGAGDKVRLALLGIVFKSKGLPEQYNQAQFVLWMQREGILNTVKAELQAAGRSLAQELPHMYVSSHLAKALLKSRPDLAHTEADARKLLKEQFPQVTDVTSEQMTTAIADALSVDGKFPLTLVVLDEVQQFIGADAEKAFQVQEVTETLSKHFNGKLLFVGTGQSALSGMPNLQRLMGRFPVQVMLGDWDVENVTRQIILAKKPTAQPEVEHVWRANLGEISRHLRGTKLEHVTDDEDVMTSDYPLLPVRRRFWERVLRTIDTTGTVSQLRSQLRVVHEAVLDTAEAPLGHVVSGDFLYDQIAANLVSTAQLPKEVFENVQRFAAGNADSQLKARLAAERSGLLKPAPDIGDFMGSYVNASIGANEQIVYEAKVSWFSQLPLVVLGVVTLPIFIGALFLLVAFVRIWTTELAITNKRIIAKFGLISRSTVELRLEKVESVRIQQSILGRILNYGSVVVAGAGVPQAPIPGISSPLNFRGRLNTVIEEKTAN